MKDCSLKNNLNDAGMCYKSGYYCTYQMNDRYLFRAKRIDNGEWVEGGYAKVETCDFIILPNVEYDDDYHMEVPQLILVDPSTICQFTGRGNELEHDVFEYDGSIYEIVFDQDDLVWYADCDAKQIYIQLGDIDTDEIKMIGNAIDNPELLDGGTEC